VVSPDDPFGTQAGCLADANAQVANLDNKTYDLDKTWNPTGFYAPADIQKIVLENMALISNATDVVGSAPLSTSDAQAQVQDALGKLFDQGQKALIFTQAVTDARAKGVTAINAQGLKKWVIDSMQASSSALVTAAVMSCNTPWLASAIMTMAPFWDRVVQIAKAIVGVVIAAGEQIITVASDLADLWPIIKWGALALGAFWAYTTYIEPRMRG
jgi:hypothetical protein